MSRQNHDRTVSFASGVDSQTDDDDSRTMPFTEDADTSSSMQFIGGGKRNNDQNGNGSGASRLSQAERRERKLSILRLVGSVSFLLIALVLFTLIVIMIIVADRCRGIRNCNRRM